eukprot:SAG11_NODE_3003_length_2774_cov_8.542430_1_plen_101_part_00
MYFWCPTRIFTGCGVGLKGTKFRILDCSTAVGLWYLEDLGFAIVAEEQAFGFSAPSTPLFLKKHVFYFNTRYVHKDPIVSLWIKKYMWGCFTRYNSNTEY